MSIVLPAYNEEHRIGATLDEVAQYREETAHELDIVVVDDGSTDNTAGVVHDYMAAIPELRLIQLGGNCGKGRAVAKGMLAARGEYRAFFDADGATPISEVDKLLDVAVNHRRSVAIGSIRAEGAEVERKQPLLRTVAGRLGNSIIRWAVLPEISDSQRGCKLFPAELADVVFAAQLTDGWVFDIEVLALAKKLKYNVIEVPVAWTHIEGGQIKPMDYVWTLREVLHVRKLLKTGAHAIPSLQPAPARAESISPATRRAPQRG